MWALKVMAGKEAGKVFQLKEGTYKIGRSSMADIQISGQGVSKIHGHAMVFEDKMVLSDSQSRNGLYVNGVKIKNLVVKPGDKVSIGELILDVIKLPKNVEILPFVNPGLSPAEGQTQGASQNMMTSFGFENSQGIEGHNTTLSEKPMGSRSTGPVSLPDKINKYIDDVALPVVYKLSESHDMKWTIAAFVGLFIVVVTAVTTLPVVQISRDFIEDESRRRAESLARLLAAENRDFILSENEMNTTVKPVVREPGVSKAFITSAIDGHIIAPANRRGTYSKNPFLNAIRKSNKKVFRISGSSILMTVPILENNPITGEPSALAHATIVYNMDKVALDFQRALGLVAQILIITLIAGSILYFFLYRLIIRPFHLLNEELDQALKEGRESIDLTLPTPIVQKLIANINSSLSRMAGPDDDAPQVQMSDKSAEAIEVVELFSIPAFTYSVDQEVFLSTNGACLESSFFEDGTIADRYLDDVPNEVLCENLRDLIERCKQNPNTKHSNTLNSAENELFELVGKAIMGDKEISYILFSLAEVYEEGEVAS